MNSIFVPIFVLLLTSTAIGQKADRRPSPDRRERRDRVRHDVQEDGTRLARGATYKAAFDARGATYVPFLGSKAPRSFPVTFRLESISIGGDAIPVEPDVLPARDGDTVSFDRGSVIEIYSLALDSIEQTLRFDDLRGEGDLVVRYAVETDLGRAPSDSGLRFENELGAVRYGSATAIDARGASAACTTDLEDGTIEIRVPASFLARAALPLVVDPVIATFTVDDSLEDRTVPDVAYDFNNQRYLLSYEETFSANDHDVVVEMRDASGGYVDKAYIDMSLAEYWASPKVACNRHYLNYLVVAEVGLPSGGARAIRGRFIFSDLGVGGVIVVGSGIPISESAESGEKIHPDVGSDPRDDADTYYLVVWERVFSATDHDIHARAIRGDLGAVGGVFYIDDSGSTHDRNPSISESCGFSLRHHVAWERRIDVTNSDIHAAELAWNGFVTIPSTPVVTGIAETEHAGASSILDLGEDWLLVYQSSIAGSTDHDVHAKLMNGTTVLDSANLSSLEADFGSGTLAEEQIAPDADSDGTSFTVAYSESYQGSASDYDVYAATLTPLLGKLRLSEGHRNLGFLSSHEDHPRLACVRSSGAVSPRGLVVWDAEASASDHDLYAGLYDCDDFTSFCFPGIDAIGCPCGNPPSGPNRGCNNSSSTGGATLSQNGTASLAADTVQFVTSGERPTATSIVMQGTSVANNAFGQGVRCVGGLLKRMYQKTASGGSIAAPTGSDPSVSARSAALGQPISAGETKTYLVYYRDPAVLGGCPATSGFNATQSGAITWRP